MILYLEIVPDYSYIKIYIYIYIYLLVEKEHIASELIYHLKIFFSHRESEQYIALDSHTQI